MVPLANPQISHRGAISFLFVSFLNRSVSCRGDMLNAELGFHNDYLKLFLGPLSIKTSIIPVLSIVSFGLFSEPGLL